MNPLILRTNEPVESSSPKEQVRPVDDATGESVGSNDNSVPAKDKDQAKINRDSSPSPTKPIRPKASQSKFDNDEARLGPLDLNDHPAHRCVREIEETQKLAKEYSSLVFLGELVTMETVIRSIMGDSNTERIILPIYWNRLADIRRTLMSAKKKTFKKKFF